jgi:N,N'-diacetylchitobiose transport system substrate-binding protein
MTRRTTAAGSAALLLLAAACGDDGEPAGDRAAADKPDTITVWLQPEAESGWPELLESVNAEFTASTGIEVDIQTQQWGDHLTKLDTALSGDSPPDVVELGNTETTKYLAAGAFTDLTEHTA